MLRGQSSLDWSRAGWRRPAWPSSDDRPPVQTMTTRATPRRVPVSLPVFGRGIGRPRPGRGGAAAARDVDAADAGLAATRRGGVASESRRNPLSVELIFGTESRGPPVHRAINRAPRPLSWQGRL